jgi:hypothetical protein
VCVCILNIPVIVLEPLSKLHHLVLVDNLFLLYHAALVGKVSSRVKKNLFKYTNTDQYEALKNKNTDINTLKMSTIYTCTYSKISVFQIWFIMNTSLISKSIADSRRFPYINDFKTPDISNTVISNTTLISKSQILILPGKISSLIKAILRISDG